MNLLLDFFTGGPARIKGLLIAFLATATLCLALTCWALWERAGRFQCGASLASAEAQVEVLVGTLEDQTAAIDKLGRETAAVRADIKATRRQVDQQHAGTRATIGQLDAVLKATTPPGKGCADYIKEWRAAP